MKKKPGFKKEARQPEEMKKANIEQAEATKNKAATKVSTLKDAETYHAGMNENANLLGFQGEEDYDFEERRGGRGGRGRGLGRGGRGGRGGQAKPLEQEAFPELGAL